MIRSEKLARLKTLLRKISSETALESLARETPIERGGLAAAESAATPFGDASDAAEGVKKLMTDRDADVTDRELYGLEAIVMKQGRPVVFIRNDQFDALPEPWTNLNTTGIRQRLQPLFSSIGRIELPNNTQIPYGGTGFVVGPGLIRTNRHVAKPFSEGLGIRTLSFRPGDAAIDFKREVDTADGDRTAYLGRTRNDRYRRRR